MRKYLALAALVLLATGLCAFQQGGLPALGSTWSGSGGGGITVVQHKSTACASGTTCALAFTSSVTAGNTLIYLCAAQSAAAMSAATDNNTNTIVNANARTPGQGAIRVDYVTSAHAGATTVTCTETGATRVHTHIWEIHGLASGVFDAGNTANQTGTAQSITTSGSTTTANEIVFGFFYDQPNNDSLTAGSGFATSEFTQGSAGTESSLSEVKIVSSTGTQTATATCGVGTNSITQSVATFK